MPCLLALAGCDAEYVVGATGLSASSSLSVGSAPFAVVLADLDADGALDAALLDGTPQLCTLHGHDNGTLTPGVCVPLLEPANALGVAALGAPGSTSLLAAGHALAVYPVSPDLTPAAPTPYALTGSATAVQVAAVAACTSSTDPCHCRNDVLVSDGTASEVAVYYANDACDGSLRGPQRFPVGPFPLALTWADLDGDGQSELATANQSAPSLTVLSPRGVATFTGCSDGRSQPAVQRPAALLALDLDHDGSRVLVLADRGDSSVRLLRASRSGPLTLDCGDAPGARVPVAADPLALAVADLDGDGNQDLVVAHGTPPALGVLLGGTGALANERLFPIEAAVRGLAVGDLNHDGRPDVVAVVASSGGADVQIWLNTYRD